MTRAGDAVKTHESSKVAFGFRNTALHSRLGADDFDRSIEDVPADGAESASVATAHVE